MHDGAGAAELEGHCYYLSQGWWSYELCAGHHLRQFHALPERGTIESVLTLGTYDAQVYLSSTEYNMPCHSFGIPQEW